MKEHPILFSTPMVQAILEGRKTQTRRIIKCEIPENVTTIDRYNKKGQFTLWENRKIVKQIGESPYGQPGDLLWVRETFMKVSWPDGSSARKVIIHFKAGSEKSVLPNKWRSSIHMPKAAARIWLQIEEVTVERLQSISEEDAKAEGAGKAILWMNTQQIEVVDPAHIAYPGASYKLGFQKLWISINGIESWHENPWVWVVKFKVISTTGKPSFDSAQDDSQNQVSSIQ